MDYEALKVKAEEKCKVAESLVVAIKGSHGSDLKEKLFDLTSYLASINELVDRSGYFLNMQKRIVDLSESLAMQSLCNNYDKETELGAKSKIPATLKPYYVENFAIKLKEDSEDTTLYNEKTKLEKLQYIHNRYKSTFETVKIAIMVAQSGLSFDREEMKNV